VVKRGPAHVESGTVIHTSIGCTLEPIYARAGQGDSWPAETHGSFLAQIPGAELKLAEDFVVGDYVIYRDNIGQINDIYEIVSIRLNNGSIVKVKDPDELEIAQHMSENPRQIFPTLAASLKANLKGAIKATGRGDTFAGDPLHLGQTVFTKKANLRLGEWVYGAYDPSVPPRGVVVDVQTTRLYIDWITSNIFERQRSVTTPPTMLLSDEFPELIIFNKGPSSGTPHTATAHLGSRHNGEFSAGEHVRFRDIAGAAVKYAEPSRHGQFHRIPRTATSGYDMNVFLVKETKLTVTVQWQDATTSIHEAKSLIPYLNVDDHDVWVGEIVGDKTAAQSRPQQDAGNESVIYPKRVGVVQSANARERVATVRWFVEPAVGIFDEQRSVLLPGSTLGQLGNEETQVSLYEIVAYPALTRRRGDLVLIAPSAQLLALHSAQALLTASTGSHPPPTMPSLVNTDPEAWLEELRNLPQNDSGPTWFGEIIDLGTDGLLTVRLGALQEVYDVRVPVETLITVVGGDDAGLHSDQDSRDDYYSDDISMSSYHHESDNVIEETVEYEGGQRIDDDGGDEVWTTDDDDPSKESPSSSNEGSNESESEADDGDARSAMELPEDDQMLPYKPSESPSIVTAPNLEHGSESTAIEKSGDLLFSTYRDMPEQFEILDEDAPADHHFLAKAVGITGGLLRRIRQEHGILKHSLPDGVWVRTWAERLDLLRVLIIGAHDTPYEMAPFVLDFQFHQNFPRQPPSSFFHSWDQGVGRINPNMYEDGKVCLSLLGTWDSDNKGEGWSKASSMLQIIVSLLGLVLVREPYYSKHIPSFLTTACYF
jgi:ubiquitin-conjugating enzyme E2 O